MRPSLIRNSLTESSLGKGRTRRASVPANHYPSTKNVNLYASFTNWKFTLKVSMKKGALKVRAGSYEEEEDRVWEVKCLRAEEQNV